RDPYRLKCSFGGRAQHEVGDLPGVRQEAAHGAGASPTPPRQGPGEIVIAAGAPIRLRVAEQDQRRHGLILFPQAAARPRSDRRSVILAPDELDLTGELAEGVLVYL